MRNYIIYYTSLNDGFQNEKMAKVKAENPDEALNQFYSEFTPPKYEATGFEEVTAPCNW